MTTQSTEELIAELKWLNCILLSRGIDVTTLNKAQNRLSQLSTPVVGDVQEALKAMLSQAAYTLADPTNGHLPDDYELTVTLNAGAARRALSAPASGGWNKTKPPYDNPVIVKVGDMTFKAKLLADASMDEDGNPCDQWQAVNDGEHPPCWSDGARWENNEEGAISLPVDGWIPLPASPSPAEEVR